MERKEERESVQRVLDSTDPVQHDCPEPRPLLPYWKWLVTETKTPPIEFFLSLLSLWYCLIVFGVSQVDRDHWSPIVISMNQIIPITAWGILLLFGSIGKVVGLAFRITLLRLVGLAISVCFWLTLGSISAYLQFVSPSWGGYVIIGLTAAWAFIRMVWETSDPIAARLRRVLEERGHVRRAKL